MKVLHFLRDSGAMLKNIALYGITAKTLKEE
jgi:hypothetical protein